MVCPCLNKWIDNTPIEMLDLTAPRELLNSDFDNSQTKGIVIVMPQHIHHLNRPMPSEVENAASKLTEQISRYMILSLFYRLHHGSSPKSYYGLSYDIVKDCEMIIEQVLRAFNNPIILPWAIEDYAERLTPCQNIGTPLNESQLRKDFPPLFKAKDGELLPLQEDPCIVVDSRGIIVLWYLPCSLSRRRNDTMTENIQILNGLFQGSLPAGPTCKKRQRGYKTRGRTTTSPGTVSFSPCWYNLAYQLSVSTSLRGWPRKPGVRYLHEDRDSLCILGAAFSLIHPIAAKRGLEIMDGIANGTLQNEATNSLDQARLLWSSPFTAFSVISNRETEVHRDGKGFAPFYDLIATVGNYTGGRFEVPGIGLRFRYDPGTLMGLCGKALEHGAAEVDGDRFCVVQFFHRKVLELVQSDFEGCEESSCWMRVQDFTDFSCHPGI